MSRLFRVGALAVVAALALGAALPLAADEKVAKPAEGRPIDIVICLDVSGSMNGLIDSAKLQLWNVVNEMARIKPAPQLRVALYSYGANHYDRNKGWVKKHTDLTEDLDEVYKELNVLKTGGGDELVARVTKAALDEQKWSTEKGALKLVFVCGNEAADQDKQVKLEDVAAEAKKAGVIVNTIYCKYGQDNEIAGWAAFSESCGGRHVNIDQNKAVQQVVVRTEYDEKIIKLGEELNKTYVAYGKDGKDKADNQKAQDANAAKAAPAPGAGGAPAGPAVAAIARAESKAGALYRNSTWDLVDAMKAKDFDLKKIKEEDLCEDLKKIKPEDRMAFLKKKADERADLQKQISELSVARQKKIDEELAKKPKTEGEKALDEAFKALIRDQAKAKGFEVAPEKK